MLLKFARNDPTEKGKVRTLFSPQNVMILILDKYSQKMFVLLCQSYREQISRLDIYTDIQKRRCFTFQDNCPLFNIIVSTPLMLSNFFLNYKLTGRRRRGYRCGFEATAVTPDRPFNNFGASLRCS